MSRARSRSPLCNLRIVHCAKDLIESIKGLALEEQRELLEQLPSALGQLDNVSAVYHQHTTNISPVYHQYITSTSTVHMWLDLFKATVETVKSISEVSDNGTLQYWTWVMLDRTFSWCTSKGS